MSEAAALLQLELEPCESQARPLFLNVFEF